MLFNSIEFGIFLPIVFFLYWFIAKRNLRLQNLLLIIVSYIFYGWWDWRFLSLIVFSSSVDYLVGIGLSKYQEKGKRKVLLYISILVNLGFLGFFKYFDFFVQSFVDAFTIFGMSIEPTRLRIILPVGISFYTFQTLSYSIDVYKRKLEPTKDILSFFAFVSFFPQLVAGPIERATNLLPQFYRPRIFSYDKAVDGMRQILWGFFKKVVIADNCAQLANYIFDNHSSLNSSTLVLGAVFFGFQIYGDFSGYSDIAIGVSRLFGFNLRQNFAFPYFSRDIAEFWRRWHISLSTWFRDYLYIPLGGSKGSLFKKIRNTFIIFIVSGFWHGANWTFIIWGFLNALYFLPLMLGKLNRRHLEVVAHNRMLPTVKEIVNILTTFALTTFAWIFFRAEDIGHAFSYIAGIFTNTIFSLPDFAPGTGSKALTAVLWVIAFLIIEWFGRNEKYGFAIVNKMDNRYVRLFLYAFVVFIIGAYMQTEETPFIYFQF